MTELTLSGAAEFFGGMPYFTAHDPKLIRSAGTRDPLGFLPVWSAFARRLVPNVASPVGQINGIKAVLLILWLTDHPDIVKAFFKREEGRREFFRLMEGLIEYWLFRNGQAYCYGNNTLRAEDEAFALTTQSGKTVANGLYQYYRGTCRRAGFLTNNWTVEAEIAKELRSRWDPPAIRELIGALKEPLENHKVPLIPAGYLRGTKLSRALELVFSEDTLRELFKERLFGEAPQRDLARQFMTLQTQPNQNEVHEVISKLQSDTLAHDIHCVLDCEPFLLVMQDVFDVLRASAGKALRHVADRLESKLPFMCERASAFLKLGSELETARMRQMQALAATLVASASGANAAARRDDLIAFMRELVEFHQRCMVERERDPLMVIEGTLIVSLVPGERDPQEAIERIEQGYPWMNDYYFHTTSKLYDQVFGAEA